MFWNPLNCSHLRKFSFLLFIGAGLRLVTNTLDRTFPSALGVTIKPSLNMRFCMLWDFTMSSQGLTGMIMWKSGGMKFFQVCTNPRWMGGIFIICRNQCWDNQAKYVCGQVLQILQWKCKIQRGYDMLTCPVDCRSDCTWSQIRVSGNGVCGEVIEG